MNKLIASDSVHISKSGIHNAGRSVYAKFNFKKGGIIEDIMNSSSSV